MVAPNVRTGICPLSLAVIDNRLEDVRELAAQVSTCARQGGISPIGRNPLLLAVRQGLHEAAELLLEAGADPMQRSANVLGEAEEAPVLQAVRNGDIPMLQLLQRHGASLECPSLPGATLLCEAASHKDWEMVLFLVDQGIQVPPLSAMSPDDSSPLRSALVALGLRGDASQVRSRRLRALASLDSARLAQLAWDRGALGAPSRHALARLAGQMERSRAFACANLFQLLALGGTCQTG